MNDLHPMYCNCWMCRTLVPGSLDYYRALMNRRPLTPEELYLAYHEGAKPPASSPDRSSPSSSEPS